MREKKKVPVRKASPGAKAPKKYRMLRDGEVRKIGDEVWSFGFGPWRAYKKGDVYVGVPFAKGAHNPVRRIVSPKGSAKPAGRSRPRNTKVTPGKRER